MGTTGLCSPHDLWDPKGQARGRGHDHAPPRPLTSPSLCRMVEYSLDLQNINLSAIRTVRVLRPLKAINRVPSESCNTADVGLDVARDHPPPPKHARELACLAFSGTGLGLGCMGFHLGHGGGRALLPISLWRGPRFCFCTE